KNWLEKARRALEGKVTEEEELAHLHMPSSDPKQRMIDYWGHRAEKAEAEVERLRDWGSQEARKAFEAEKEIERLRSALKPFVRLGAIGSLGLVTQEDLDEARCALEGKE